MFKILIRHVREYVGGKSGTWQGFNKQMCIPCEREKTLGPTPTPIIKKNINSKRSHPKPIIIDMNNIYIIRSFIT